VVTVQGWRARGFALALALAGMQIEGHPRLLQKRESTIGQAFGSWAFMGIFRWQKSKSLLQNDYA